MIRKEHRVEWVVLIAIGIILSTLYKFNLLEMFKRILEWGFALTGFKLLFDYGIIQKINQVVNRDGKN